MNDPDRLREAILSRLARVIDPKTGVDVVRMRLVEDLAVDAEGRVSYAFRPSSPLCPLAAPLALEIHRCVQQTPGVTGQAARVVDYVGSDELNALLRELDGPSAEQTLGDEGPSAATTGQGRRP